MQNLIMTVSKMTLWQSHGTTTQNMSCGRLRIPTQCTFWPTLNKLASLIDWCGQCVRCCKKNKKKTGLGCIQATVYSRFYNLIQEWLSLSTLTEQIKCSGVHHNSIIHVLLLIQLTASIQIASHWKRFQLRLASFCQLKFCQMHVAKYQLHLI